MDRGKERFMDAPGGMDTETAKDVAWTTPFVPPSWLRNPHVQSILASVGPRGPMVRQRAIPLLDRSRRQTVACGGGVRLQGELSAHGRGTPDLVVLLHGWEGSAGSLYLLSAAASFFDAGYDVFRLNFRDHGPTHHLNRELFHACRIDEVVGAVGTIADRFGAGRILLCGFSLGGNFALRAAARAPGAGIPVERAAAVCPVLDPVRTMEVLETGWFLYHSYFLRKWRRSLRAKLRCFPDMADLENLSRFRTLRTMTDFFAPRHTGFPSGLDYLRGYAVVGNVLEDLSVPTLALLSLDDPVIPAADLRRVARPAALDVEVTRYGGHCGFLQSRRLESWAEGRLLRWFRERPSPAVRTD